MKIDIITSAQNIRIKDLLALQEKSKESDIEALMAELKALKGEQSAKNEAENKEESTDTTEENQ